MRIELKDITKKFQQEVESLNIPTLSIQTNQTVGFIGNNGSGKTTLFKLILDLLKPTNGEVLIDGKSVGESNKWKEYTGSYIDEKFLIDFLYPEEYFHLIKDVYKISDNDYVSRIELFADFMNNEILDKKKYIQSYSKGNKQKIGIIGAMLPFPDILILDEPFNFLDPTSQSILNKIINAYGKMNNKTILISSHNINYINDLCDKIILLEAGKIKYNIDNIKHDNSEILNEYFRI
ncbi:ABC transporter ATP-binding protein [Dysgonomonas sp. 25]|uniref:ABC transporter ATP-binding protein n=1 Tax=Dysgonomonas sp. 25 TaxID=2302933 RepID=UPI0013D33E99|nr:ABC transporter ATP-binding protein [Dysgonomonas sp. 25]NDV68586.1 ABC transporter ATP-binding protein [Dysgonomonas sp. 25]